MNWPEFWAIIFVSSVCIGGWWLMMGDEFDEFGGRKTIEHHKIRLEGLENSRQAHSHSLNNLSEHLSVMDRRLQRLERDDRLARFAALGKKMQGASEEGMAKALDAFMDEEERLRRDAYGLPPRPRREGPVNF